ncbi:glycoside hydrolase family 5 protein [Edaphobacter bradus]|uniref:glycoside hydrolase family 5 protein n=1 Tax=Edaphobacter bradus TaxID=2259016 RepID=UPI0021E02D1F|nr:glycoside hydrolase family 5 protein [Edaphobacter bradus]
MHLPVSRDACSARTGFGVKLQPVRKGPGGIRHTLIALSAILFLQVGCSGGKSSVQSPAPPPAPSPAQMTMLHASGRSIVNANGQVVPLTGVNLGGWFIMEKWMCPLDSGSLPDTYSVIQELDNRFGVATEQSLITTYQQNWITTTDLDNIKNAGFNVVRVPVWWGQFYPINNVSNASWRSDAFTELDWLVTNATSRGLYVIIDMHGVVGSQSTSGDTGQQNTNQYWTNSDDQGNTAYMWSQIANHYKGNLTIAGYDLMNEPTGAPSDQDVINAYNNLYKSVRSADPDHMIFMEGTWGSWNWNMLPNPSQYGWTNVVYEMHEYQFNGSQSKVEQGSTNQVNDFNNHANYNVPGYIGEFNDFGYGSGTWNFSVSAYNKGGLSWTMWAYKATHGLNPDSWGFYDPTYWPTTPNISTDSASTITADWQQWKTTNSFGLNTSLGLSGN